MQNSIGGKEGKRRLSLLTRGEKWEICALKEGKRKRDGWHYRWPSAEPPHSLSVPFPSPLHVRPFSLFLHFPFCLSIFTGLYNWKLCTAAVVAVAAAASYGFQSSSFTFMRCSLGASQCVYTQVHSSGETVTSVCVCVCQMLMVQSTRTMTRDNDHRPQ